MVLHIANGPVAWIQHPFVFILVGFLVFLFLWHLLQLEVAPVLSCLSKNIQRSNRQRGCERFLACGHIFLIEEVT